MNDKYETRAKNWLHLNQCIRVSSRSRLLRRRNCLCCLCAERSINSGKKSPGARRIGSALRCRAINPDELTSRIVPNWSKSQWSMAAHQSMPMANLEVDLNALQTYLSARQALLREIDCCGSCRDPLAEFSAYVVARQLNARLAVSRVQKGFDLVDPSGRRVQVKYLSNPNGKWINVHTIEFPPEVDVYALAAFEAFELRAVLVFPKASLESAGRLLRKRHPDQERTLQFTQRNFLQILHQQVTFEALGIRVFQPKACPAAPPP